MRISYKDTEGTEKFIIIVEQANKEYLGHYILDSEFWILDSDRIRSPV